MYALEPAWRDTLQAPAPGVLPLAVGDGLDAASWAGHEFGGARLGDARLSARLVLSAEQMAESPMRAITGAANGVRALVKGHYRLIDQPAESAVTVENILAPHRERTLRRMRTHDTVLCIQDGTRLNFTRRSQTRGLGTIGSNQTGAAARGLDLHTTLAINPDGVALGVLRAAFDAPEPPNGLFAGGGEILRLARPASRSSGFRMRGPSGHAPAGGRRVCHGAPATSAPVDHASRTGWGRTVRPPCDGGHGPEAAARNRCRSRAAWTSGRGWRRRSWGGWSSQASNAAARQRVRRPSPRPRDRLGC